MSEIILATPENMTRYARAGLFAYSFNTDETCSATAGDYFWMRPDECLQDEVGEPMVLATAATAVTPLDTEGN